MTVKPLATPGPAGDLDAARVAEESCRIVGMPGFYPECKVGADYVERFTPVMESRLKVAAVRPIEVLNWLIQKI
jgi:hypothetical protein